MCNTPFAINKDNSEGTQPQISSFFGGQEDISNTPKNSWMEKVKQPF
jgi:hypothetical protein